MSFLEKDLEEIIYNYYELDKGIDLKKRGLNVFGKLKKQLRIGKYGVSDLVSFKKEYGTEWGIDCLLNDEAHDNELTYKPYYYPKLVITVYELKKNKIGISALLQAVRYAKGISNYLDKNTSIENIEFKIVLIGSKIDTSGSFCYLPSIFKGNIEFYTYRYEIDGIYFNKEDEYSLIEEGF